MGILNVTPDSFSDGGKYNNYESAVRHAEKMIEDGADIIDIGAMSTRPFSEPVPEDEEWARLERILKEIKSRFDIPVSVDTYNTYTAEKSLKSGADIINDVSGIINPDMAALIKEYSAGWILMHGGVKVNRTESEIVYPGGIVKDVNKFFSEVLSFASSFGIDRSCICLDPGFGFAKNAAQNIELLKNMQALNTEECTLLCALSKKRFIGEISNAKDVNDRSAGTLSADIIAALYGSDILRVHDVGLHRKALDAFDRLMR